MSLNHLFLFIVLEAILLLGIPLSICGLAQIFKLGKFRETVSEPVATNQQA